MTWRFSPVT